VPGFCFELRTISEIGPNAYLRWDISSGPIRVALNQSGSADLPVGAAEKALLNVLGSWQGITKQNVQLQYDGRTAAVHNSQDQINVLQWIEKDWQYSSYAIAVTSYTYYVEDPPTIIDADILLNGEDYRWSASATNNDGTVDIQQTLTHETGHMLGLSHTSVVSAQMFPFLSSDVTHTLSVDDRAAVRFLYGTPPVSFKSISPVKKAAYVKGIAANGLPLPVFRWTAGPDSNYTVEFSNTSTFEKKIRISTAPYPMHALTAGQEKKLLKLATADKIYWRVKSGGEVTPVRVFTFK